MCLMKPAVRPFLVSILAAGLAVASLSARPTPTPLAELDPLPLVRDPGRIIPRPLDLDLSRLTSLGEFHTAERDDGLYPEPRFRALVEGKHGFRSGQGLLLYRVLPGGKVEPVGSGRVAELHPLGQGRERMVVTFRCAYLGFRALGTRTGRGRARAVWEAGFSPERTRYFTHPGNFTGMLFRDYQRLTEGKIWVGMTRWQARLAMGLPGKQGSRENPFGWREVWSYPRSARDRTSLIFANDQLRSWQDSWTEQVPEGDRWSWQKRPTRNPWMGRDTLW